MNIYREITDGIIDSLLRERDSWSLNSNENPKEEFLLHESGHKIFIYSGSVVTSNGIEVNLPESMRKEITEFTILMKRNRRKFKETSDAILMTHQAFKFR